MSIFSKITEYVERNPMRFHTPGHKGRLPFNLTPMDITELDFSDSLFAPIGMVKDAETLASIYFGSLRTHLLVNGSTSGVLAALLSVGRGSTIIISRNSHKSVYNGCLLAGVTPVVVGNLYENDIPQPLSPEQIKEALDEHPEAKAVLLTCPNYFGQMCDVVKIKEILGKDRYLFVDEAHGAHYNSHELFPESSSHIADICIDSGHKTMPVLTQGAFLSVNNPELLQIVEYNLNIINTTSPSYLLMGSLEFGVEYMNENSHRFDALKIACDNFRRDIPCARTDDFTRIAFDASAYNLDGRSVERFLIDRFAIYPEFSTNRYVVFIVSIMDSPQDVEVLNQVIWNLQDNDEIEKYVAQSSKQIDLEMKVPFVEAPEMETELIEIKDALGRVSAREVGLFPPCVPTIVRGEIFTQQVVDLFLRYTNTFGMEGDKLVVIKEPK